MNQTYLPATALVANQNGLENQTYLPPTALVANHNGLVNQIFFPATRLVANHNGLVNQTYLPATALVANHNGLVNQTYLPPTALVAMGAGLVRVYPASRTVKDIDTGMFLFMVGSFQKNSFHVSVSILQWHGFFKKNSKRGLHTNGIRPISRFRLRTAR